MSGTEGIAESPKIRPLTPFESKVRERVKRLMHREKYVGILSDEKFPRISIEFYLTAHMNKKNAEQFGVRLREQKPQVVCLEAVGYSKKTVDLYNQVASGHVSPHRLILDPASPETPFDDFISQLYQELYNSKAVVLITDIPQEETEFLKRSNEVADEEVRFFNMLKGNKVAFDTAVTEYPPLLVAIVPDNEAREAYALNSLEEQLAELIAQNPHFKKLPSIKVMVAYGALHTPLAHAVGRQHADSHMRTSTSRFVFSHRDEAIRLATFGKEIPRLLMERALIESIMGGTIRDVIDRTDLGYEDLGSFHIDREVIESFSSEELRTLYNFVILEDRGSDAARRIGERTVDILKRKGARFTA